MLQVATRIERSRQQNDTEQKNFAKITILASAARCELWMSPTPSLGTFDDPPVEQAGWTEHKTAMPSGSVFRQRFSNRLAGSQFKKLDNLENREWVAAQRLKS